MIIKKNPLELIEKLLKKTSCAGGTHLVLYAYEKKLYCKPFAQIPKGAKQIHQINQRNLDNGFTKSDCLIIYARVFSLILEGDL